MPTLSPGDTAPDFTLPDPDGNPVSLSDFRGKQKVVLYAYPAASTPGCTTQACDFRDNIASLQSAGYQVLGLSPDGLDAQKKFRDEEHVPYPLLCDPSHEVLESYGAWGEKSMYGKKYMGIIRSAFLVDEKGKIQEAWPKISPKDTPANLLKAIA